MINADPSEAASVSSAQALRLKRILSSCVPYASTALIVTCVWLLGFIEGRHAAHFALAALTVNVIAIALVRSGLNLRLKDPSMTAPLLVVAAGLGVYVMYHLQEPMLRAAFLLMASVVMLFGALAFDLRRLLRLGGVLLISYLLMLLLLARFAPERLNVPVEIVMAVAYTVVLAQIAFLGSYIAGLRRSLREKHASLLQTMSELEELATRDPLTRLPNRRTAMQQLERELSRTERRQRDGDGLCIGLLDVDLFKRVNDRFGHQAGDEVLRLIGATLHRLMRQGDFVARFGGEEFLVILPETTLDGGAVAAERMRGAIAAIDPADLPVPFPITVSIGIADHSIGRRMEETLEMADQALYQAKHLGRNRVVVWQQPSAAGGAGTG